MKITCVICGGEFNSPPCQANRRRTCSVGCLAVLKRKQMRGNNRAVGHKPNATCFKQGLVPWNKGVSVSLSPETQFKKGIRPARTANVGDVKVRIDKQGNPRAWIKIAEPREWKLRAVLVWEKAFGSVPRGNVVHHVDRDTLNDSLENLRCLSRSAHIEEHRGDLLSAKKFRLDAPASSPGKLALG